LAGAADEESLDELPDDSLDDALEELPFEA
jgi:hypothetical protein